LGFVVGRNRRLERAVVLGILERANDGLGCEAVTDGVRRDASFPADVLGPVLLSALRRLASFDERSWRSERIGFVS